MAIQNSSSQEKEVKEGKTKQVDFTLQQQIETDHKARQYIQTVSERIYLPTEHDGTQTQAY